MEALKIPPKLNMHNAPTKICISHITIHEFSRFEHALYIIIIMPVLSENRNESELNRKSGKRAPLQPRLTCIRFGIGWKKRKGVTKRSRRLLSYILVLIRLRGEGEISPLLGEYPVSCCSDIKRKTIRCFAIVPGIWDISDSSLGSEIDSKKSLNTLKGLFYCRSVQTKEFVFYWIGSIWIDIDSVGYLS